MKVKNVTEKVKFILENKPKTRDDDYLLYAYILNDYGYSAKTSFLEVLSLVNQNKVPSIESVGRARRKCQELYPLLQGTIINHRRNKTSEFIQLSKQEEI